MFWVPPPPTEIHHARREYAIKMTEYADKLSQRKAHRRTYHSLKVEQHFQATLRDLRLVRCVLRRILEYVSQQRLRRHRRVVARAEVRAELCLVSLHHVAELHEVGHLPVGRGKLEGCSAVARRRGDTQKEKTWKSHRKLSILPHKKSSSTIFWLFVSSLQRNQSERCFPLGVISREVRVSILFNWSGLTAFWPKMRPDLGERSIDKGMCMDAQEVY